MARYPKAVVPDERLEQVLTACNGNLTTAAKQFGKSGAWLSRTLKERGFVQQIKWVKQEGAA